ncbi:phosphogluconate dehydrogenase (NAD(+)-dependent, decarboxylating) [Kineobactrum salinum]|uniref:Decarboxylating 6-phosphogluconate dehydrogenase n=1 Tax=Kineobactrum salinum TaxID=2708301 RepID=A0A6C0U9P9_9GAMM|nr:decarboxylating 6-phosphogluconate dehydrogenase [Kineobactrum salinum]QIB67405.1 decarboxylating 6-phosphogluconate dehydrogenase [Kineobactrum salinum]
MQLGIIGLGRMGGNIARRLMRKGHELVVYDHNVGVVGALGDDGATATASLTDLIHQLKPPRAVWMMLPAGEPTEQTVTLLGEQLEPGDIVIDGGNTLYKDDIRRAKALRARGVEYVDVGTSGGVWGLERGYCMMVGADKPVFDQLEPLFEALAPGHGDLERTLGRNAPDDRAERGYIHAGPVGAGHFVKMVHNGIEYGLMQAYAEGFDIMKSRASEDLPEDERFDLNLADVAEVWRRGSVVSSWLLDLTAQALAGDPKLDKFTGAVADSGEGRWTIDAAVQQGVSAPVLATALFVRFRSQNEPTYADKLLSAMRFGFGGHVEIPQ